MRGDLTNRSYWSQRQKSIVKEFNVNFALTDWFHAMEPLLREYEGKKFIRRCQNTLQLAEGMNGMGYKGTQSPYPCTLGYLTVCCGVIY